MAAGAIKNTVKAIIIEEELGSIELKNDFLREIEILKVFIFNQRFLGR